MAKRTDFNGSNTQKRSKSPCSFQKTACSFHSFEPILSKRAKKKSPANPLVYRTSWRRVRDSNPRFLLGTQHFECCTFDHSDNSPCMLFRISSKNFWKELTERTTKYLIFEPKKTSDFTGFFSGANNRLYKKFRVLHLRPLGQLSVSIFVRLSFQKFAQKFVGEKTGETAKNIRF